MNRWSAEVCWIAFGIASSSAMAQTITWNCDANSVNLSSTGQVIDGRFRFELGVFEGSFVPTFANMAEWAAYWRPAQRRSYDSSSRRYAGSYTPQDNSTPFVAGKPSYVWGFSGNAVAGEWILFRNSSWLWPEANPLVPPSANAYEWFAKNAEVVAEVGMIHPSGIPFFMKTAAVFNVAPPSTTFIQWRDDTLAGESLNGPESDPDHDGSSNLLEFVFDTPPRSPNPPTSTPIDRVGNYLQITIPRRIDHKAILMIEVSDDLKTWSSGVTFTQTVSEGLQSLVVRETSPQSRARFMRLKAEVATP
jgi:hypothetical protein